MNGLSLLALFTSGIGAEVALVEVVVDGDFCTVTVTVFVAAAT
jgi:hypothetical protein